MTLIDEAHDELAVEGLEEVTAPGDLFDLFQAVAIGVGFGLLFCNFACT